MNEIKRRLHQAAQESAAREAAQEADRAKTLETGQIARSIFSLHEVVVAQEDQLWREQEKLNPMPWTVMKPVSAPHV